MMKVTSIRGPIYRSIYPPYRTVNQKAATNRKLSQASPVVHDIRPTSLFRGTMNGCEYARARVTCGGVASNRGDF
jgi:hypothetical protein